MAGVREVIVDGELELRIEVLHRGTRSEGRIGRLHRAGREVRGAAVGDEVLGTLHRFTYLGDERPFLWSASGWSAEPLPSPDEELDVTTGSVAGGDGVVVERLVPGDEGRAGAALTMMHDVFDEGPEPLSEGYLARLLAEDSFMVVAAFEAGDPVGCITAHELPMTRGERSELFVYDLAVRTDRHRRGIGRRLVAAMRAEAERRGIGVVYVAADDDDADALAFYDGIGGRPARAVLFDLGPDGA